MVRREVAEELSSNPSLVEAWQEFCDDQRASALPFFKGTEVGFVDHSRQEVTTHATRQEACADYITREAAWVLERVRVRP